MATGYYRHQPQDSRSHNDPTKAPRTYRTHGPSGTTQRPNAMTGPVTVYKKALFGIYARLQHENSPLHNPLLLKAAYRAAYQGHYGFPPAAECATFPLQEAMMFLAMVPDLGRKLPYLDHPIVTATTSDHTGGISVAMLAALQGKTLRQAVYAMAVASLGADDAAEEIAGECCSALSDSYNDEAHVSCSRSAYLGMRELRAGKALVSAGPCSWPAKLVTRLIRERFRQRPSFATEEGDSLDTFIIMNVSEHIRQEVVAREFMIWRNAHITPVLMADPDQRLAVPARATRLGAAFVSNGVLTLLAVSKGTKMCLGIRMRKDGFVNWVVRTDIRKGAKPKIRVQEYPPGLMSLAAVLGSFSNPSSVTWLLYDVHRSE